MAGKQARSYQEMSESIDIGISLSRPPEVSVVGCTVISEEELVVKFRQMAPGTCITEIGTIITSESLFPISK